jgi:hypothetical protein
MLSNRSEAPPVNFEAIPNFSPETPPAPPPACLLPRHLRISILTSILPLNQSRHMLRAKDTPSVGTKPSQLGGSLYAIVLANTTLGVRALIPTP